MSAQPIFFAPLRVPITDPNTGLISREWYLFFQAMYLRVGGAQAPTPDDLQLIGDLTDANDDGNDIRASVADFDRALSLLDESPTTAAADIAELQLLTASWIDEPIPIGANPSAAVGLAAVNGKAKTFMTSDSAPALDQSIVPTWTGIHTFSLTLVATAGAQLANASVLSWKDTGAVSRTVMQMFSDNNVYLDSPVGSLNFRTGPSGSVTTRLQILSNGNIGFNAAAPIAKPTVTGSKGANAALASVLTALANYGLITDSST
jgi:hypothetical protein